MQDICNPWEMVIWPLKGSNLGNYFVLTLVSSWRESFVSRSRQEYLWKCLCSASVKTATIPGLMWAAWFLTFSCWWQLGPRTWRNVWREARTATWVFTASMHTLPRTALGNRPDSALQRSQTLRTLVSGYQSPTQLLYSQSSPCSHRALRPSPVSAIYCAWSTEQEQTQSKVGTWPGKIRVGSEKKGGDRLKMKCWLSLRVHPPSEHGAFNKPEQDSGYSPDGISEASNYDSLIKIK